MTAVCVLSSLHKIQPTGTPPDIDRQETLGGPCERWAGRSWCGAERGQADRGLTRYVAHHLYVDHDRLCADRVQHEGYRGANCGVYLVDADGANSHSVDSQLWPETHCVQQGKNLNEILSSLGTSRIIIPWTIEKYD